MRYYAGKYGTENVKEGRHCVAKRFLAIFLSLAVLTATLYTGIFPVFALETEESSSSAGIQEEGQMEEGQVYDTLPDESAASGSPVSDDAVSGNTSDEEATGDESSSVVSTGEESAASDEVNEAEEQTDEEENIATYADEDMDDDAWKQKALDVELTGNFAADVLAIAESQAGYQESTTDVQNGNGRTLYGREIMNNPYFGGCTSFSGMNVEGWDPCFVTFCTRTAGIPTDLLHTNNDSALYWYTELSNTPERRHLAADGYADWQPQPGDIVFFKLSNNPPDRIGIVSTVELDDTNNLVSLTAIEGDVKAGGETAGQVARVTYTSDDLAQIFGFADTPTSIGEMDIKPGTEDVTLNLITTKYQDRGGAEAGGASYYQHQNYLPDKTETVTVPASEVFEATGYVAGKGTQRYTLIPASYFEGSNLLANAGYTFNSNAPCPLLCGWNSAKMADSPVNYWGGEPRELKIAEYAEYENKQYVWLPYVSSAGEGADTATEKNVYFAELTEAKDTVSPSSTTINLFDYWTSERGAVDSLLDVAANAAANDSGINANHRFKFYWENITSDLMNDNTVGGGVRQGIVKNTLGDDGYPQLSGNLQAGPGSEESLAYLFSPSYEGAETAYRAVYTNVQNLLSIDSEGYYGFDAAKRGVQYDEASNRFIQYTTPLVVAGGGSPFGQFFPFEDAHQAAMLSSRSTEMQHYFGMTLSARFIQQYGGHTSAAADAPETVFNFSGDDDVWIFIDGVLVADLGGCHSANSVEINFADGTVTIDHVNGEDGDGIVTKKIRECFEEAGVEWSGADNGDTFRNGTSHTLDFYYLERGNWDSTLSLKYNLTEIPATAIYKVDQYGDSVAGATFAVYPAALDADGETYRYLDAKDGKVIRVPESCSYNENGDILDAAGNVLVPALYKGTTDTNGEMIFMSEDGSPLSLTDMETRFGTYFILREIEVPDGYRQVSADVWIRVMDHRVLRCVNTYSSGTWAATTLQVTAQNDLYFVDGTEQVTYFDPTNAVNPVNGTLFGVVFKYTGEVDADGVPDPEDADDPQNWTPVYGSDMTGYEYVSGDDRVAAAIEAAQHAMDYGDVVFRKGVSGQMELSMTNLPGRVMEYKRMLEGDEKRKARYRVEYYWTADTLDTATTENTHRVYAANYENPDALPDSYDFSRVFGARIRVPNLINRLFVQKLDEDGNHLNNSLFALYQVEEEAAGTESSVIYYIAADGTRIFLNQDKDADNAGTARLENGTAAEYQIADSGDITVTTAEGAVYTIEPVKTAVTTDAAHNPCAEDGTAYFTNLLNGTYYVREIKTPSEKFELNTTEIMVLITDSAIYANAGVEGDGVTVARGPGYIVSTLAQFASEGQIDNTLSWVYERMRVSDVSKTFADVADYDGWKYLKANHSAELGSADEALSTHLIYDVSPDNPIFNYVVNADWYGGSAVPEMRRLYTPVGWSRYEVYQDYDYGAPIAAESEAGYTDLRDSGDISNLFSRSVFLMVTDRKTSEEILTNVAVKKVSAEDEKLLLSGAAFRLWQGTGADRSYYSVDNKESVCWESEESAAAVVTTGEDGIVRFVNLKNGTYYLEEIEAPNAYQPLSEPIQIEITSDGVSLLNASQLGENISIDNGVQEQIGKYIYTITVPNLGDKTVVEDTYRLPLTGGIGVNAFYVAGGLLITGAAALSVPLRRSRKKKSGMHYRSRR